MNIYISPEKTEFAARLFGDTNSFHQVDEMKRYGKKPIIQGLHLITTALDAVTDNPTPHFCAYFSRPISSPAIIAFSQNDGQLTARVNGVDMLSTDKMKSTFSDAKLDPVTFNLSTQKYDLSMPSFDKEDLYYCASDEQSRYFISVGLMTEAIFLGMQDFILSKRDNLTEEKTRNFILNKGFLPAYQHISVLPSGKIPNEFETINFSISYEIHKALIPQLIIAASGQESGPLYIANVGSMLLPEKRLISLLENID